MNNIISVFNYIGSKSRMSGQLSSFIPKTCTIYVEPYCGSAALALNSRKFDVKILNDFNPHIANFWAMATNPETREKLFNLIKSAQYSWSEFEKAKAMKKEYGANRKDKIQWAFETYILNTQSYNGAGDSWVYREEQYNNRQSFDIKLAFKVLSEQNYRVHNMPAIKCMEKENLLDNPNAFIFLDPPYLEGLRCDGKLYEVDMPSPRDHIDLLKAIRYAKAKIVLSGYWSGRDDGTDLYDYYLLPAGWHRHLLGEYTKGCEVGQEKSKGAEWVWCNYDLETEAPGAIGYLKSYCDDKKSTCLQSWLAVQSTK